MNKDIKTPLVILFTGLPASGKTTLAEELRRRLWASGQEVTVLDGDRIRSTLNRGFDFSRADRDENVWRVAFIAGRASRKTDVVICSIIAPYTEARRKARWLIEPLARYVLIYVSTPLEVCEARDPKGLYAKARAGEIENFTGVSDPYEAPTDAELVIDTTDETPEESVACILKFLEATDALQAPPGSP
jgi:sulfate adenylyltransferase